MQRRTPLVVAAFLAVSLIWGSTYLGLRVALESFPPFVMGALRFVGAGAVLLAIARLRGEPWPVLREWRSAALTGVLFFVIGNGLIGVAERTVASGLVSVLVATMPLWTLTLSHLTGERPNRRELAGVTLGLAGVAIMNLGGELRASPSGTAAALLAPMGWALGSLASKRLALPRSTLMRTAAQMVAGGVAMLLVSFVMGERLHGPPSARALAALAYLGVFGSLVGFSAYQYLLANVRASVATSYAYVNPVIAVGIGVLWAGEHMDMASAVGSLIVLAAVVVVARGRRAPQRVQYPAEQPARPRALQSTSTFLPSTHSESTFPLQPVVPVQAASGYEQLAAPLASATHFPPGTREQS